MLIDVDRPLYVTLDDVLSEAEAQALMARIDDASPTVAPITTPYGPVLRTDLRNNERATFDDPALAMDLFARVADRLPDTCHGRRIVGLNERFRCYRYRPGMRFGRHRDGAYIRNQDEQSYYSALFYLDAVEAGGDTVLMLDPDVRVAPARGRALFFQHWLPHEGQEVLRGVKYVARSDVMYRRG